MRLTVDKNQFLKALSIAGHAVPGKSVIPVLSNLKLELTEKGLEITGSNSKIAIKSIVPNMIDGKEIIHGSGMGATLVDARILTEAVRRMEGETVSLDVIDDSIAKLGDGKSTFKLTCTKAEEYPDIDLSLSGTIVTMGCAELCALVDQSAFAASTKEQRPILTALNLEASGGNLTATATDSARLARKTIAIGEETSFRCNVPARTLSEIVKLFEVEESVTLSVEETKIVLKSGTSVVSSRLVSGDYPVTRAIIPQTFNYYLEVNAQELLNAMSRVSILSNEKEPVVKLSMKEDEVEVSSKSDLNGSANERLSTFQYTGEPLEVSFNSTFVIDAIKALKAEDVTVCFQAEMKPFVVKNPKDDSVVELITPMRTY